MCLKNLKLLVCALVVCIGFNSCSKDDDPKEPTYVVKATLASLDEIAFIGGEVEVTVEVLDDKGAAANISWSASVPSSVDWITFDPQRGKGAGKFKIIAAANKVEATRTATITVTLAEGGATADVTAKQQALDVNWKFTRKGKFQDFCVGVRSAWGGDWGNFSAGLYYKCELGANGVLTLNTNYRMHYHILEVEPGYIAYISVPDQQFASAWEVEITPGRDHLQACGLKDSSSKYLTKPDPSVGDGNGELWDHGRGKLPATYTFHLRAGTYWLVALRAGVGGNDQAEYPDMGQYPVEVPVDEVIEFKKD